MKYSSTYMSSHLREIAKMIFKLYIFKLRITSSMNATPKAAKVVLNELEAMRKKLKLQNRNPSISLEGEAKNGSSIM